MGALDPNVPRVNDPELEANLIRLLDVVGPLGTIRVLDVVMPVVSLGNVVNPTVDTRTPSWRAGDTVFGQAVSPAQNTVLADTGALPAGTYDVFSYLEYTGAGTPGSLFILEHRNAANNATLATLLSLASDGGGNSFHIATLPTIGYELGLNERLRTITPLLSNTGGFSSSIFARRRG